MDESEECERILMQLQNGGAGPSSRPDPIILPPTPMELDIDDRQFQNLVNSVAPSEEDSDDESVYNDPIINPPFIDPSEYTRYSFLNHPTIKQPPPLLLVTNYTQFPLPYNPASSSAVPIERDSKRPVDYEAIEKLVKELDQLHCSDESPSASEHADVEEQGKCSDLL